MNILCSTFECAYSIWCGYKVWIQEKSVMKRLFHVHGCCENVRAVRLPWLRRACASRNC